jgi:hypothetical protein
VCGELRLHVSFSFINVLQSVMIGILILGLSDFFLIFFS